MPTSKANTVLLAANLGGIMGLCLGFSLLSLYECIYFFTLRMGMDHRRNRRAHPEKDEINKRRKIIKVKSAA